MKGGSGRLGAAWFLLASAAAAHGQAAPDAPRERAGPAAQPPRLPGWEAPTPAPRLPRPEAPPLRSGEAGAGGTTVREVVVTTDAEAGGVPPRRWRPPDGSAATLRVEHRPGEALDAEWVRRQFAANNFAAGGATVADAVTLVQLLNRAFVTAGFVNSGLLVPEQRRLNEGVLELRLVQGGLTPAAEGAPPVTVEFARGDANGLTDAFIRNRFPSARQRPISAYAVERDFRLLAESAAIRTVNAELRPGARAGEASLHLLVEPERRANLYLGYANDRSPSVGSERAYLGGYLRNVLRPGDLVTAEIGRTRGVDDAQLGYSAPLATRTSLTLRGSLNNAAVIDRPLLPLDISARDRSAEGGFVHRFVEEPLTPGSISGQWRASRTLSTGVLLAYREQRSFLFGAPFSFSPGSENGRSRYAALRFTGDYLMRSVDQVLALSLTGTVGLGGTRSDTPGVLNPRANFLAVLAQAHYARRLGPPGLELRARLAGQAASSVLYSGERLSVGGQSSVRGYRENLFLVDKGAIGSLELGWTFSLAGAKGRRRAFDPGGFSATVFADAAVAANVELPEPARRFIASLGAGLAWTPAEALRLSVSYAEALRAVPRTGTRDLQDRGIHFRATVEPLRLIAALKRR